MRSINPKMLERLLFAVTLWLLVFLTLKGGLSGINNFFGGHFISPIFSALSRVSKGVIYVFADNSVSPEELERKMVLQTSEIEDLKKENNTLYKTIGISSETGKKVIPVLSSGFYIDLGAEVVVINKGREFGIEAHDEVITGDKVYVGRVLSSGVGRADVILASSRNNIIDVYFLKNGVRARARGTSGGEFIVDLVPEALDINKGDLFVPSFLEFGFMPGLTLGETRVTASSTDGVFKNIRAIHLYNPYRVAPLFVIHSGNQ